MDPALPAWTHLLAGVLIALGQRVMPFGQYAIPMTARDRANLVRRVSVALVNPLWSNWFQIDAPHSRTDLDWAIETFLIENPTRTDWYRALLHPPTIEIEWREQQPFIVPRTIARWEMLANFFDVDSLLTFDLVAKHLANRETTVHLPGLEGWRTLPWVSDHELRRIIGRGVSDLHIHVGGVRIAQALWLDLMEDRKEASVLRILSEAYRQDPFIGLTGGADETTAFRNIKLSEEIAKAQTAWRALVEASRGKEPGVGIAKSPTTWWTWDHRRLNRERWVLIGAWHQVLHTTSATEIASRLHEYLAHKHRFFRLLRQPVLGDAPGLRYFDDQYFRRAEPSRSKAFSGALGSRLRSSPRRDLAPFADACMYLMESPNLRRMELRFAPWGTKSDLVRLFLFWRKLEKSLRTDFEKRNLKPADIRFALHFVRSSKGNPLGRKCTPAEPGLGATKDAGPPHPGRRRTGTETERIMKDLDLASARLRLALGRQGADYRDVMTAVARIDVAGQERDTQISQFVMHMRLLRGDADMLEVLEGAGAARNPHPCRRWLTAWLKVRDRGMHIATLGQPGLGMTAHAGEDYAQDTLDGVTQIGVAVEYLALRAGDSLGHALALITPLPDSNTSAIRMIPRGVRLDSLCWLHDMLEQSGERLQDQLRVRAMIERLGHDIYARCRIGLTGLCANAKFDDFIWVWKHKMLPMKSELDKAIEIRRAMVRLEYEDDSLLRQREIPMQLDNVLPRLDEAIELVRQRLLDEVKRRRIVVEMNPASNLRVSGATRLRHSPTVALARRTQEGLLACINTDNPGVFGSRIENEYALLLQGLNESGMPQGEARRVLEEARQIGMDLLYWPGYQGLQAGDRGTP